MSEKAMTRRMFLLLGATAVILASCASDNGDSAEAPGHREVAPGDVAALDDGTEVRVTGIFFATTESVRLCEGILESYPPQCGEPAVELAGITAADVIGLSQPTEPDLADVVWSDFPLSVFGTVQGGAIVGASVDQRSFSSSSEGIAVRLSFTPDPLESGSAVAWLMDVTNERAEPLELTFPSGQNAEVELSSGDEVIYRWSGEVLFTQALRTVMVAPGERYGAVLPDDLPVEPGDYEITGWFVANEIRDLTVTGTITVE